MVILYTRLFTCAIQKRQRQYIHGFFERFRTQSSRRRAAFCIKVVGKAAGQITFTSVFVGTCIAETCAEFPRILISNSTSSDDGAAMHAFPTTSSTRDNLPNRTQVVWFAALIYFGIRDYSKPTSRLYSTSSGCQRLCVWRPHGDSNPGRRRERAVS